MNYQPDPDDHVPTMPDSTSQAPEIAGPQAQLDALAEDLAERIDAHLGLLRGEGRNDA